MSPNIPASIKGRLLNIAREKGEEFEFFLVRFACERFLYRLGASQLRNRFILKGAALLALWMKDPYRATRDLDFLATGPSDEAAIRDVVRAICSVPCPEDGMTFDLENLEISEIRAEQEYPGQRAVLIAHLGKSRIRLQVDFGFGDAVTLGPQPTEYPTLLPGLASPRLRTYPREFAIAEKFEAMVKLGRRNSRMKDFHDIWALSSQFAFDGAALQAAVSRCFERRGTAWTAEVPDVLTATFYSDAALQSRWAAYKRAGASRTPPPSEFDEIGELLRQFLGPVRDSIMSGNVLGRSWRADGHWEVAS
ncbi:MAG: nucleotidyl transferase AbiEii/AbiGii toxin family protein [Planctomycetes bacterium]|nr:nucleotidyl transferase AbiEii/AbiGii toxin family protein [Planctomycetota bacterium]